MAAGAGGVLAERFAGDLQRAALARVAGRAAAIGGGAGLVHLVTVEAAARAGVVVLLAGVARGARPGLERRRAVRAVAVAARLIAVRTDGSAVALWLGMAGHAARRRAGRRTGRRRAEAMAVLTARCPRRGRSEHRLGVERGADLRVAAGADLERRRRKAVVAVAIATGDAARAHVGGMAGALANVAPGERHVARRGLALARTGAREQARGQREHRGHAQRAERSSHRALRCEPTGWQSRHGSAVSGRRLDQPGGCGLPPTPPTAWHLTHSDSPAPE
jgi:hypothetical protein